MENYTCAYCGKVYNSPNTRAQCELECFQKLEEHRQKAELLKKMEEERLLKLRQKEEHEAIEKELGEAVTKAFRHAKETGMHHFYYEYEGACGKTVYDLIV